MTRRSEISVSVDAETAKLERTTDKMVKNRRLSHAWIQWLNYVNEARLSKKEEKAAAAKERQEQQQQQLKQQLEKLQSEHHKLQIEVGCAGLAPLPMHAEESHEVSIAGNVVAC